MKTGKRPLRCLWYIDSLPVLLSLS